MSESSRKVLRFCRLQGPSNRVPAVDGAAGRLRRRTGLPGRALLLSFRLMEDRSRMYTGFGVGATFFGVVFGISGQTWAMVLCLLAGIASILWGIWPALRKLWQPARQKPEPLSFSEKVMKLPMPDELRGQEKIAVAFADPHFGLVAVKNEGTRNISSLIPEVNIDGRETASSGAWTTEQGKTFEPLDTNGVTLNVGAKRLLVVAVAFPTEKDRGWGGGVWYPVHSGMESKYYFDKVRVLARDRNLGTSARIEVRFRAEGVDQTIRFNLAFEPDGSPAAHVPLAGSSL